MKFVSILFLIVSLNSFAQNDLNFGGIGISSGLHYSKQQSAEKFHYFDINDISYTLQTFSQFRRASAYGSVFYQSKRYNFNKSWSFQYTIKFGFYRTKNVVSVSNLISSSNVSNVQVSYTDNPIAPRQKSASSNIAPSFLVGLTRKMGKKVFFHLGLGYTLDYSLHSNLEWEQPFPDHFWQTISYPNKPGERINQDFYMTLNPYWHLGEKLQLGLDLSLPIQMGALLEPNQIFIPGKHNNFMLRNYFLGLQLALRLDTSYDGCGSCP